MSLDGAFLHIVTNELQPLIGARVDKVYQPSREEIVVSLRTFRDGGKKIVLSANSVSARLNLTAASFENPQQPPMFCMLLRKHLSGGKLMAIRQDGLERVISLDFECTNEIGDIVTNTLIAEIMGRHSNIILVRDGRVIDSVKRITDDISSVRRVLPGIQYEAPPRQDRLCLLECAPEQVLDAVKDSPERLCKKLTAVLEGVSPILTREIAWYCEKDTDVPCNALTEGGQQRLLILLYRIKGMLNGSPGEFTIVSEPGGKKKDFCFIDITQYSGSMTTTRCETANGLLDEFFASQDRSERTKQRAHDLLKLLMNSYERISRKLELQKKSLRNVRSGRFSESGAT